MNKIKFPIYLTTVILVVYTFLVGMDLVPALVFMLFGISPLLVIWLVYRVLRDGEASAYTFSERFYEDERF
jgi:hypothetical protein